MIIYLDILIVLNLFVDYFLLLSCGVILKTNLKRKRLIFSALVGSFSSLLILLPSFSVFVNFFIKIMVAVILVLIAFGYKGKQVFLKTILIFFAENLIFVGVMFFVWIFVSPPGMLWKNGVTYIKISPFVLVIGSLAAYVVSSVINFVLSKRVDFKKIYKIELELENKKINLNALHDTGNHLIEPFSKKPVCVCEYEKIKNLFSLEFAKFFKDFFNNVFAVKNLTLKKNIKLIPCDGVSSSFVLPAFLPKSFNIILANGKKTPIECYVAVTNKKISDGEYNAIIGDFKWKEKFYVKCI